MEEKDLIKLMEKYAGDGYNETLTVIPEHLFIELAKEIQALANKQQE